MAARNTLLSQKTCKQITALVQKYLNDSLGPRVKQQFDEHLINCPDCVAFLNTYRKTVAVSHAVSAEDMPKNVRRDILSFLQSRARRRRTRA